MEGQTTSEISGEAEEEAEDTNVRTYENAVTLYEDKQYYPDAEDVSEGSGSKI